MAFTAIQLRTIESILTLWKVSHRPDEEVRDKVDLDYTVKGQDIFLEEIRPVYRNPGEIGRYPFAKIKFEKSTGLWKIYWMRGNLKWYPYEPKPQVGNLDLALEEIMKDPYHCFFW
ncbi:DUF3024 domain-containing protein [Algoriphagus sp. CAU 1675]|uniref:DUF3024 domain-containing protein n=1 Tax=Algoriphagus sp. CAU 1675 TaxID=3032597 RepID=UPI0023DC23E2|nr:DUF3024 domain-containing protein [Algoriphagus sp. CAU 1675]MDF2156479.1 DUF3024 domain-containing protein [Algoriphagus sp. CAU 1675]